MSFDREDGKIRVLARELSLFFVFVGLAPAVLFNFWPIGVPSSQDHTNFNESPQFIFLTRRVCALTILL
jgi:hypothetical protein